MRQMKMWKEEIQFFDCLDSTNLEASRQAIAQAPEGCVIVAKEQTDGRGRRGRSWCSPQGNLYFSLVLRPKLALDKTPQLTLLMGLAVAEAMGMPEANIKWPNDVVIGGRKVCGILAEMAPVEHDASPYVIIGVGVNFRTDGLEDGLQSTAIGLDDYRENKQHIHDANLELLYDILDLFQEYYEEYCRQGGFEGFVARYNDRCVNCNREVAILGPAGEFRAIALGVNANGELLVRREDGTEECITAGEVSVRGIYGYV